jgi:Ca2+-binding EF-hand superfamily protein
MNPNTAAIQALINNIDPDNNGKIDYDELVSTYLKINAGTMQDVSAEIKRVLPAANGVAYGALAITAETLVDTIDADHNGQVSNLEIANIIIANKKNNILSTYAPELVAAIYRTNPNKTTIEALINQIGGADGNFTDAEVASAILAQRLNPNIYGANAALVEAILSAQNSSYSHIKNLISSIDGDNNGTISNLEAMKSVVKDAKGLIPAADKPLVDSIISSNTNLSAIKTAYNGFSINPNSATLTQDLFGKWIEIQQGVRTGTYFDDTVEALGKTSELNALKTQFTALDIDGNGRINDTEFGSLLVDIAKGVKSLSSYQTMINYLVKDPALLAVKNTIDSFGNRSDDGMLRGLLGLWNPTNKALLNKTYVQSILALNPDSAAIQKILTLVDPQKTGVITNGSTVGYITSLQIARYSSPQIDVAKYDFNGNNSIDQSDFETYNAFYQYITNSNGGVPFKVY